MFLRLKTFHILRFSKLVKLSSFSTLTTFDQRERAIEKMIVREMEERSRFPSQGKKAMDELRYTFNEAEEDEKKMAITPVNPAESHEEKWNRTKLELQSIIGTNVPTYVAEKIVNWKLNLENPKSHQEELG